MNIWDILGIEKTKSEEEIVEAYRSQLVFYNPEDDAEGFMRLRQAYEEAIAYSRSEGDVYEQLMEQAEQIYGCFRDRIDAQKWKEFLQNDLFQQLDTRIDAEARLIMFLMIHYRLPQAVLLAMSEEFDWANRRSELNEHFSEGFFDYIFDVIDNGEYYKMDYFDGDDYADYDLFIEHCMNYAGLIHSNPEAAIELEKEMDELEIYHPFYYESKAEFVMLGGQFDKAEELTREFPVLYPNEPRLLATRLRALMQLRLMDEAKELAEMLRAIEPEHRLLKLFAILLLSEEDIEKAKDEYYEFNRRNQFGEDAAELAQLLNQILIPHLEAKESELSGMDKVTLAWCYYEGDDLEKAYQYLDSFEPEDDEVAIKYYKLKGYLSVQTSRFAEAIEQLDQWEILRAKKGDTQEEEKIPYEIQEYTAIYHSKIDAYIREENFEKVEEYLKKIIEIDPRNLDAFITLSNLYNDQGRFGEIVAMNTEAMQRNGEVGPLLYLTALAEFRQEHYGDAFRLFDAALEHMPYLSRIYHYKLLMYDGLDFPDDYEFVLGEMKNGDLDPFPEKLLELHEIKLIRMKKDLDEAERRILKLIEATEEEHEGIGDDDLALIAQEASIIYRERREYSKSIEYIDKAIEHNPLNRSIELDKGYLLVLNLQYDDAIKYYAQMIEKYPSDAVYHIRMAATQKRAGNFDKSIAHYKKAIELDPERLDIHTYLAEAYAENGEKEAALASKTYVLEKDPSGDNYYERATLYYRFKQYELAYEDLQHAKEANPYDADTLTLLGICAMQLKKYEEAEQCFKQAQGYLDEENFSYNPYLYPVVLYFRMKRYEDAADSALTLIEKFGVGSWILMRMIEAYQHLGRTEEVEKCFSKLFEIKPDHPGGHYYYTIYLFKTKGTKAAKEYLSKIMRKYPNDHYHVKNAGLFHYMFLREYDHAIKYYEKAYSMEEQDLDLDYINLFESKWYKMRSQKGVLQDSMQLIEKNSNKNESMEIKEYFSAMTDHVERYYEKFGEYEGETGHYFGLVAEAHFFNGDYKNAERYAYKSIETMPEDSDTILTDIDALHILGMIHELRGEYEKAKEFYQKLDEETKGGFFDFPIHDDSLERIERKISGTKQEEKGVLHMIRQKMKK